MFLKRLEIQGFKSFPEKIKLDFKYGITAIVGPNGSGKSNISDAIRWVLGEQSVKNLRGEKMEDIIFAGTKNRKPLGFAQVSIILDNSDKKLNLEYSEINITRKVFRSGESGYYINGTACRLKDIQELFMDTGIGKEGYSIIGQGKIDAILTNKAEERRAIFEEAAGITKFKNRRIQAENRLSDVDKNLVRANDIIAELERQIAPLEIQANKAKDFLILQDELKLIKVNIFKKDYKSYEQKIEKFEKDIKILLENIKNLEIEKENIEKRQSFFKEKIILNQKKQEDLAKEISNYIIKIEQEEANVKLDFKNIEFIEKEIEKIEKDRKFFNKELGLKNEEIYLIKSYLDAKNIEYSIKKDSLKKFLKEFEEIKVKIDKNNTIIKKYNIDIMNKIEISSKLKNKLANIENIKSNFEKEMLNIFEEKNLFLSKLNEKNTKNKALEKKLLNFEEKESLFKENISNYEKSLKQLEKDLQKINEEYFNKNKYFNEILNRQKILIELEKDFEGYNNSVKSILKEKGYNLAFSGIYGAIGELIKLDKAYEMAIEIALGGAIQNIVVQTEEDAKIAIKYLKENKKGRATFLPISSIKSRKIENLEKIKKEKGFIGLANQLIEFDKKFDNIFSSLLGSIIVINNIENAINFAKKSNYKHKIVTLNGEFINSDGALTGGSVIKKSVHIFSRNREIEELKQKIDTLQNQIKEILLYKQVQEKRQAEILNKMEYETNQINLIFKEKALITAEIQQNNIYINEIKEKIDIIQKQEIKLNNEFNFIENEKIKLEIKESENEISYLKKELLNFEDELENEVKFKEFKLDEINNLKIEINFIENEINNSKKDIERLEEYIKKSKKYNIDFENEILKKQNEQKNIKLSISLKNENIKDVKNKHKNLEIEYENNYNEKIEISNNIENFSNDIFSIIQNIAEIKNEISKISIKKESAEENIETFANNMWEQYKITYADACNNYKDINISYEILKEKEKELKNKINLLGPINLGAIEEYKSIKERYELNIEQKNDILNAIEDLKYIIKNLTKEMEIQFKEKFDLINKNFGYVFSKMFGGGIAKLKLTNEEDLLISGIDIVAQPPGKNLQSLSLLSGGERTLAAISLIFAIIMMKPSPFCILDETEASLDDSNVNRYANFLKEFSNKNQFILVTHKTGTMEIADFLYGVTMEEQGISKIISVELKDANIK